MTGAQVPRVLGRRKGCDLRRAGEPLERVAGDVGRHGVWTLEFLIPNCISGGPELWDEGSAGGVDRKDLISGTVRDKDAGTANDRRRLHETGRERENVSEKIAVGQPHR